MMTRLQSNFAFIVRYWHTGSGRGGVSHLSAY